MIYNMENSFDAHQALWLWREKCRVLKCWAKNKHDSCLQRESDLVVTHSTGVGKTVVNQGAWFLEKNITVWVPPLKSICLDTLAMARKVDVTAVLLSEFQFWNSESTYILLVSPEERLCGEVFLKTMKSFERISKAGRIAVDQSHFIQLSDEYRSRMAIMRHLGQQKARFQSSYVQQRRHLICCEVSAGRCADVLIIC